MREKPPYFDQYCVVIFDAVGSGTTHARFDMLAASHGNGDLYEWQAGGRESTYKIVRGRETAVIDGWPINTWTLTETKNSGEVVNLTVDCINAKVYEDDGQEASFEHLDTVYRASVDAAYEREEQDKHIPFFLLGPEEVPVTNPNYEG